MKIIEVVADHSNFDTIKGIAEQHNVVDCWYGPHAEDGRQAIRILLDAGKVQPVLDALQSLLGRSDNYRVVIIQPEAVLPRVESVDERKASVVTSREELYNNVAKSSRLDSNFLILVVFSTIVAAIGLLEDNVAVIIGAMVIAPLLGPNLALALGTSLGDKELVRSSLLTNFTGLGLALLLSVMVGVFWDVPLESNELMDRTGVGLDSLALALASGAAAVLSLTTGLSSVLVGVMVAVALLPPTATMGIMLGSGELQLASGAALLLAANIVCVNLSAKLVFLFKGIKPRTWLEKQTARQSMVLYSLFWTISLALIVALILYRA